MEASRLNIAREKSPTVIFTNKGNPFTVDMIVGDKGQLDVEFEVVGKTILPDDNGNDIMRYTLRVIKATELEPRKSRA